MKRLKNKFVSRSGETLVESMAAILIFTLSSVLLLSMIATSSKINYTVKVKDKAMESELSAAEAQNAAIAGTQVTEKNLIIKFGAESTSVAVKTYDSNTSDDDNTLRSFAYKK